jgi:hypothetical protein
VSESEQSSSRRALLTAALGGAAAVAAQAALPIAAQAHDVDDVQLGAPNSSATTTEIDASADNVDAFKGTATGTGAGVAGAAASGPGVRADSDVVAGVYAVSGDDSGAAPLANTASTGAYGYTPTSPDPDNFFGAGLWGDSPDVGVYGSGTTGVFGSGAVGVEGDGFNSGGIGVLGYAGDPGTAGVYGYAGANDRWGLYVQGRVHFSRSGRSTIAAGHASKTISKAGVTSSSLVFAVLRSNRSGRWVRAVVPASGKFTVYLNNAVTKSTDIVWWILN